MQSYRKDTNSQLARLLGERLIAYRLKLVLLYHDRRFKRSLQAGADSTHGFVCHTRLR